MFTIKEDPISPSLQDTSYSPNKFLENFFESFSVILVLFFFCVLEISLDAHNSETKSDISTPIKIFNFFKNIDCIKYSHPIYYSWKKKSNKSFFGSFLQLWLQSASGRISKTNFSCFGVRSTILILASAEVIGTVSGISGVGISAVVLGMSEMSEMSDSALPTDSKSELSIGSLWRRFLERFKLLYKISMIFFVRRASCHVKV